MHAAGDADFWWASLFFRITSTSIILAPSRSGGRRSLSARQLPFLALIGIGDMFGNLLFAAASTSGLVSITSVLASLYPIVTVVLARMVLRERVARSQEAGIGVDARRRRADLSWLARPRRQLGDATLDLVTDLAHRLDVLTAGSCRSQSM